MRILIVEDHPDSANMLQRLLQSAGYATELAETVAAARQVVKDKKFDVL